jgi:thiopeptide-type bacteriocin biosynthesis protein
MCQAEKKWLSAYLYYAEPWENLLARAVKPLVEQIFEQGLAEQFFFIRYWERGPHLRLRFKGEGEILEHQVKSRIEACFTAYVQSFPSERYEVEWVKALPDNQKWHPNHSIQYVDYEPEIERYGGPVGILIAEKQFHSSSNAVLSALENGDHWSYDQALGTAIQFHVGLAAAMGMDLIKMREFYDFVGQGWLASAYGSVQGLSSQELNERTRNTFRAFEENFQKHQNTLTPFLQTFWEGLQSRVEFDRDWLNNWITQMAEIKYDLHEAHTKGLLEIPKWFYAKAEWQTDKTRQRLWPILSSYVHMANNRLGVLNRDEAYLGYLIKRSLESL